MWPIFKFSSNWLHLPPKRREHKHALGYMFTCWVNHSSWDSGKPGKSGLCKSQSPYVQWLNSLCKKTVAFAISLQYQLTIHPFNTIWQAAVLTCKALYLILGVKLEIESNLLKFLQNSYCSHYYGRYVDPLKLSTSAWTKITGPNKTKKSGQFIDISFLDPFRLQIFMSQHCLDMLPL